jgi:hypothetical protein
MNDLEKVRELRELKKILDAIRNLPQLLTQYDRLKFRLQWMLRDEGIPKWMIPSLTARKVSLAEDVLLAVERKIRHRNHSSGKSNSVSADTET